MITEELKKEYKEFLVKSKRCNFQQSIEWGEVKKEWKKDLAIVRNKDGKIIMAILLLIREIKFFGSFIYVSRGPIYDDLNEEDFKKLNEEIKRIAKENNAIAVLLEPDVLVNDEKFRKIAKDNGYIIKDNIKGFSEQINPRFVFRLNIKDKTEEELMKEFHSKTRYNIRYAEKKGVEVFEGTREDLKTFQNIMVETGERDNFGIRPLEYFERMYDCLGKEHFKLLMARHEGIIIAGIILVMYGNKVWYAYGASSNTKRNLMPNYKLQWEGIKYAKSIGAEIYDFRGVPGVLEDEKDHPEYGLYRFKKGFNATFTEFIGQVLLEVRPFKYRVFKIAQKVRRRLGFIYIKMGYLFKKK